MINIKIIFSMSVILILSLAGCGSSPSVPSQATTASSVQDELDIAIRDASDYLNNNIPKGSKIVILNVQSDSDALSDYIIDELIANAVNDKLFSVVDRQQLDLIRQEQNFQFSGEVDDDFALSVGKFFGAQTIVSGRMNPLGERYRLTIRALNVQTAEVQGQYNRNLAAGTTITALINTGSGNRTSSTASSGSMATQSAASSSATSSPSTTASTSDAVTSTNTVTPSVPAASMPAATTAPSQSTLSQIHSQPGLYVNDTYQGQMDLMDAIDWIALNVRSGGNYVIVLGKDEAASNISLSYNNLQVNVTIKSSGIEHSVRYDTQSPSYSLITVGPGVTFILEDGVSLVGLQSNSKSMVRVANGTFIMNSGIISGNRVSDSGAGVYVDSGTFTLNNGIISGNSAYRGGGVYINQGIFTMNNGIINENNARSQPDQESLYSMGGGVYVNQGTFTMNGGSISGNSAPGSGGGVYANANAVFIKSDRGGIIYGSNAPDGQANRVINISRGATGHAVYAGGKIRNTTARISQAMDSRQSGAAGGWE